MSTIVEAGHQFLICPYNDAHQILSYRFQKHLVKCARQHPHIKLETCPFNACHRVFPEKLKQHKDTCPDRIKFEKYLIEMDIGPWKKEKAPDIKPPEYKDTESWDDMVGQGGYDPKTATESMPILRRLIGATPSQKRKFYEAELKRLQRLKDIAEGKIVPEEVKSPSTSQIKEEPESSDESSTESSEQPVASIKEERVSAEPELPENLIIPKTEIKEELQEEEEEDDDDSIEQIEVKQEIVEIKEEKDLYEGDEVMAAHMKRQQDLYKIVRRLRQTNPLDPRLCPPEDGGRRERSLSPIFNETHLTADPRLKINPFAFIKGKEVGDGTDPRLRSLLKRTKQRELELKIEPTEPEFPKDKNDSGVITSDSIDDNVDDIFSAIEDLTKDIEDEPPKKSPEKRIARSASVESRESGEVSETDELLKDIEMELEGAVGNSSEKENEESKRRQEHYENERPNKSPRTDSETRDSSDIRKQVDSDDSATVKDKKRKEKKERKKKRKEKKEKRKIRRETSADEDDRYIYKRQEHPPILEYSTGPPAYPHAPIRSEDYNFYYGDALFLAHRPIKKEPGYEEYYY